MRLVYVQCKNIMRKHKKDVINVMEYENALPIFPSS